MNIFNTLFITSGNEKSTYIDVTGFSVCCDDVIVQTWRRTIEGASKVFMEKHYNRHKRLINDIV